MVEKTAKINYSKINAVQLEPKTLTCVGWVVACFPVGVQSETQHSSRFVGFPYVNPTYDSQKELNKILGAVLQPPLIPLIFRIYLQNP